MEQVGGEEPPNPLEPVVTLVGPQEPSAANVTEKRAHPQDLRMAGDSAVTKAEKYEKHGMESLVAESSSKKRKLEDQQDNGYRGLTQSERRKGVAPIKPELAC